MFSTKISKREKLYVHILSKHNLYQLYCHWSNKYLPSIHKEPSAGNRAESETEKVPVFWSQINSRRARITKIKELIITNVVAAVPEKHIKDVARKPCETRVWESWRLSPEKSNLLRCEGLWSINCMLTGEKIWNREDNLKICQILHLKGWVPVPALPSRFNPTYGGYFIFKKKKKKSINGDSLDDLVHC